MESYISQLLFGKAKETVEVQGGLEFVQRLAAGRQRIANADRA